VPIILGHLPSATDIQAKVSTVTITGTVVNDVGDPLARVVVAFFTNGPAAGAIAQTLSNPSTGAFSITLPGSVNTEFAFVVSGELGENWVVHSHKKAE